MRNYYNEFDPQSAAWIRELIDRGLIPAGDVDTRSIIEVTPSDLHGYTQCHFFAGIAGWSLALQIAGIPATRPLWTGSCPCQPFSVAGEGKGIEDDRHLWPVFFGLIHECKPPLVFGEQVASSEVVGSQLEASFVVAVQSGDYAKANKIAKRLVASKSFTFTRRWVDGIQADLETADYTMRFGVLGAHSVSAPHIRQRLYWGAVRPGHTPSGGLGIIRDASLAGSCGHAHGSGVDCGMADSDSQLGDGSGLGGSRGRAEHSDGGELCGLAHADGRNTSAEREQRGGEQRFQPEGDGTGGMGDSDSQSTGRHTGGAHAAEAEHGTREGNDYGSLDAGERLPWFDSYWHQCRDGKYRRVPVESVHELMVNGFSYLMGDSWNGCLEEIQKKVDTYATETKTSTMQILRSLWDSARTETIQQPPGRSEPIPFEEILLFALLELARNQGQELECAASHISEMEKGTLRVLREQAGEITAPPRASHQRGLDGSPSGESDYALCGVSSEVTPESGNKTVQALLGDVSVEWNVREALAEIQEIWRRHTDESSSGGISGDLRDASGIIRASGGFPLASSEGFKVKPRGSVRPGLLKGSGNAIVPEVAAEFVKAFIETTK